MQCSVNKELFNRYVKLFYDKYKDNDRLKDFLKGFRKSKLQKNCSWWEGISVFSPSTNNGCESMNSNLKKNCLAQKVHTFSGFITKCKSLFIDNTAKSVREKTYCPS